MSDRETSNVVLARRGMTYGPKLLLPVEWEEGGRGSFVGFRLDCDAMEPGTCGTTTRQCAICCVAPAPRFTGEAARVLLDILFADNEPPGNPVPEGRRSLRIDSTSSHDGIAQPINQF